MMVYGERWHPSDLESSFLSAIDSSLGESGFSESEVPICPLFSEARRGIVLPMATDPIIELELRCLVLSCF